MSEITAEQILEIKAIVDRYENFKCVECATNIKDYLTSQGIPGKRIKLYTGEAIGWNGNIYDDSVPGEAISVNGCHEGIAIFLNNVETVFDNYHPDGLSRDEWMANLQFHDKILNNKQFQIKEEEF
jgi:Papain fold toxin 2